MILDAYEISQCTWLHSFRNSFLNPTRSTCKKFNFDLCGLAARYTPHESPSLSRSRSQNCAVNRATDADAVTRGEFTSASRFCPRTINNKSGTKSSRFDDGGVFLPFVCRLRNALYVRFVPIPIDFECIEYTRIRHIRALNVHYIYTSVYLRMYTCLYMYTPGHKSVAYFDLNSY